MNRLKYFLATALYIPLTACGPLIFFGMGAAAGVGAFKFHEGALTVVYEASFLETWNASLKVMDDLMLKVVKTDHDLTSGEIEARRGDDTPVTLSLAYRSGKKTEVVIRVGIIGDKKAALAIKDRISKALFEA